MARLAAVARWLGAWGAAACLCALCGCAGRADLQITALNFRSIDPPPPYSNLRLDACYWWTEADGRVWIAMERRAATPLGAGFSYVFQLSLMLERLPAGSARNYLVGRDELRAVARFGPTESRFVSTAGIVALYRTAGGRLRGSVRLQAARQVSELLGGWSRPAGYLFAGTFEAVHDARRGRAIAAETEGGGFGRSTTRPSTSGAAGSRAGGRATPSDGGRAAPG